MDTEMDTTIKSPRMIVQLRWNETSGVDQAANLTEGWLVRKSVGGDEATKGDVTMCGDAYYEDPLTDLIDDLNWLLGADYCGQEPPAAIKNSAQAVVDYVRDRIAAQRVVNSASGAPAVRKACCGNLGGDECCQNADGSTKVAAEKVESKKSLKSQVRDVLRSLAKGNGGQADDTDDMLKKAKELWTQFEPGLTAVLNDPAISDEQKQIAKTKTFERMEELLSAEAK